MTSVSEAEWAEMHREIAEDDRRQLWFNVRWIAGALALVVAAGVFGAPTTARREAELATFNAMAMAAPDGGAISYDSERISGDFVVRDFADSGCRYAFTRDQVESGRPLTERTGRRVGGAAAACQPE
ncbi:MAG: hypothetical protein AB7G06_06340 [Bdellovibrionales bacterium]